MNPSTPPPQEVRPPPSRWEAVRAVDAANSEGAAGLAAPGVEVHLDTDGLAQLEGTHTVVQSPGVPWEAAVIAAARQRFGIDPQSRSALEGSR